MSATVTATKVKERPIIFSGAMVKAILGGRKTQTRRVVNPQPQIVEDSNWGGGGYLKFRGGSLALNPIGATGEEFCPYGRRGDHLWVREALYESHCEWFYTADNSPIELDADDPRVPAMLSWAHHNDRESCSPIHMPRWASRITLEITNVRVEQLQAISDADVIAEGINMSPPLERDVLEAQWPGTLFQWRFKKGWDAINSHRGFPFASNPWVWVLTFRRLGHGQV